MFCCVFLQLSIDCIMATLNDHHSLQNKIWNLPDWSTILAKFIYGTYFEDCRHGVSNYLSIECLFNTLFSVTTKSHQRSALLSLCEGNPPIDSPHKGRVTQKMFPFDDVITVLSIYPSGYLITLASHDSLSAREATLRNMDNESHKLNKKA